ncbi:uncharacterized protein NEMAJ01_2140 [Nematocida major]|uniref:uncharacterized protein n=1 Tax=Nematocida major TaxID=1912982 RepID=UPI0020073FD8|nr:uncharacterized protein NEMAJ01_2140 [Nematocida major]KAH9387244.1 hypothetical protein NEMAJ01_2140 [Nematocida major]
MFARCRILLLAASVQAFKVFGDDITIIVSDHGIAKVHALSNPQSIPESIPRGEPSGPESEISVLSSRSTAESEKEKEKKNFLSPAECTIAVAEKRVSRRQEFLLRKALIERGGYLQYIYRNIFHGISACGGIPPGELEKVLESVSNRAVKVEASKQYTLAYRQENLPDNFYVTMNSHQKLFRVDWADSLVNAYVRNGYLLRQSSLFQWYRNRYFPLLSNYTGKGITIEVLDGDIGRIHREIQGRVSVIRKKSQSSPSSHSTAVMTAAGGRTTGLGKESSLILHPVFSFGVAHLPDILSVLDGISTESRKIILLPFSGEKSPVLDASLKAFYDAKIPVVVSAGNSGESSCEYSPGRSKYTITVGSLSPRGYPERWSNGGECVDVYSPGSATVGEVSEISPGTKYGVREGTSISAGYTAGYISVLMESKKATVPEIRAYLRAQTGTGGVPIVPVPNVGSGEVIESAFSYGNIPADILIVLIPAGIIAAFIGGRVKSAWDGRRKGDNGFTRRRPRRDLTG